ncbi:unnamed protein product [Didymodactylos carnosus]|uniref:BTB domain-containing protein n=1 Tax=Didymodactylos carnosus TaxID=1234261 RepID=A0A814IZW6_9BILA|nr:unnamed protein product [Didymodactylos carnosus]CAF1030556.1 unnamed protein product [Didymodactylos carnosus]CAF3616638.1 unnamed protein product [Didymodactylos carnosus]CAF3801455.1 unnamed protein product [Didymodactylos carnosus]
MLVRPFCVRLSILDLHAQHHTNTNESASERPSSQRRQTNVTPVAPTSLKLNELIINHSKFNNDIQKGHDVHEKEIIYRFVNADNETEARKVLAQMWKESRFCDLMLVVDGSEYLAHRLVLAAFSPKFRAFFRERRTDFVTRTHLRHTSHKGLQLVLGFLYTGELTLTLKNVNDVLNCAKELDVKKIFEICEEFLSTFEKRRVFRVLELSRRYGMKKAFYEAHYFLSTRFNDCINMKTFLELPYVTIGNILADETIKDRDETLVLGRVLNWITSNHVENSQVIMHLFRRIRWNKLDYNQQRECLATSHELAENPKLTQFIKEQMNLAYEKSKRQESRRSSPANIELYDVGSGKTSRRTSRDGKS